MSEENDDSIDGNSKAKTRQMLLYLIIKINESPHRYILYDIFKRYVEPQFQNISMKGISKHESILQRPQSPRQKLISDIKSDVVNLNKSKNKKIEIDLFTAIIDLASYTIQGHMFGDFKVISSEPNNTFTGKGKNLLTSDVDQGVFSNELTRGERTFLCSPGFVKNWEKLSPDFMIEELMMDRKIKPLDILDEVFFQLKKDSTSGFLPYDASAIMLEVQKNVMVQM